MKNSRRTITLVFAAIAGVFAGGCDQLIALCNAGGWGTPEECEARWSTCGQLETQCAAGDADACAQFQQCGH